MRRKQNSAVAVRGGIADEKCASAEACGTGTRRTQPTVPDTSTAQTVPPPSLRTAERNRTFGPRVVFTRSVTASAPTNADIRAVSPRSSDAPCCRTDGTTFMPKGMPPAAAPPPPNMIPGDEEQKKARRKTGRGGRGGRRVHTGRGLTDCNGEVVDGRGEGVAATDVAWAGQLQ